MRVPLFSCQTSVLWLFSFSFFSPLLWMENVVPTVVRNGAGPELLDNRSDHPTIDMTTTYCLEPMTFCSQHRAVCLLVGSGKNLPLETITAPGGELQSL